MPLHHDDLSAVLASARLGLRFMPAMPLHSLAGHTVAQRTLLVGERLVLPGSFAPDRLWSAITTNGVNSTSMPPFVAQRLLRHTQERRARGVDIASELVLIGLGGGPVPPDLGPSLEATLGCLVTVGYGSTELGGPVLMARPAASNHARWDTVGAPLPGVRVRLVPYRGWAALTATELEVNAPSLALGYVGGAPIADAADGGWYRTGDLAEGTQDGGFRIVGRASTLIIRGGQNINPTLIERCLLEHPIVREAVVVGRPSRVPGEQDIAAVVVAHEQRSTAPLRAWCAERLPPLMVPRLIVRVEAIPRVEDGNPNYARLLGMTGGAG